MAQLVLCTNNQNYNSLYKDGGAIRTTRFDKNIPYNEPKENNFQCTLVSSEFPQNSPNRNPSIHNQALSDCSYEDIEKESDNKTNVLRWLRSLPSNFMINGGETNTNYCKLRDKTRGIGKKSKSLGSSLKSADRIPLGGQGTMLLGNKKKVDFVDRFDLTKMRSLDTKKKLINKECHTSSFVSRLPKKSGNLDLSSNTKNQQSSLNNNKSLGTGILKNVSRKNVLSNSQRDTIEKQIASNRRLLHSIKEVISTVDYDDPMNPIETSKNSKIKKNEKDIFTFNNAKIEEKVIKKPFLKNPAIERKLDDAMRNTLKRYVRSNTWNDFQENNNIHGEPPVKKEKRAIPSLEPVNSFHINLEQKWNVDHVLKTLRPI